VGVDVWQEGGSNWIDRSGGCRLGEMRMGAGLNADEWVHIAITWSSSVITGYMSTAAQPPSIAFTASISSEFTLDPGSSPRGIGARGQGSTPFSGYIADFRIYSQALTALQLRSIVQPSVPQPLCHYGFDNLAGNQVTDSGSLGFHGAILGIQSEDWDWSPSAGVGGMPALHFKQQHNNGYIDLSMYANPFAGSSTGIVLLDEARNVHWHPADLRRRTELLECN